MSNIVVQTKCYPKVNIFLKIAAKKGDYHEIVSRFVKVYSIYDNFAIIKQSCDKFTLDGDFGCETKQNTIYKAYLFLKEQFKQVEDYYKHHKVVVDKNIPYFAGLGGGSSNCATFLIQTNKLCNLGLSKDQLAHIGLKVGADVPFFVYEYDSANVQGIGEKVELFHEEKFDIDIFTPNVKCDTRNIFRIFREKFYKQISHDQSNILLKMKSCDILKKFDISYVNDLYEPVKYLYPSMIPQNFDLDPKYTYFSGSGSSFFKCKSSHNKL